MSAFTPDASRQIRRVFLRGLELQARLGVYAHEKAGPQRVVIGVELAVEDPHAPDGIGPDQLDRVVDYEALVKVARRVAAEGHVLLVETLAERIAAAALEDRRVRGVRVTVEKPDAFPDVESVGVAVERLRS